MSIIDHIKHLFLFNGVDFNEIDKNYNVIDSLLEKSYYPGEVILTDKHPPLGIGIISQGNAFISTSVHGNSPSLRSLTAGDTFGAASIFMTEHKYSTSVISASHCSVVYLTTSKVVELCCSVPEISLNFIKFLSNRIAFLNQKVSTFSAQSTEAKIAYYLHQSINDNSTEVSIEMSYTQLADILGLGRASLYRGFDSLCDQGIISRDQKIVKIHDLDKLRKIYN